MVSAATAWDDLDTGLTYILHFHQGLWYGDRLENSLISPNQVRSEGNIIHDDPTAITPMAIHHTVTSTKIPLVMDGVIAHV